MTCTRYYGPAARSTTGGLTWITADHHGTGQLSINPTSLAVTRRKSDPFGNPRGTQPTWPTQHGFLDGPQDPSGLTHLGAREYEPSTGRFISVDPLFDLSDPQQMQGYSYADNNPATFDDPSGLRIAGCEEDHLNCRTGEQLPSTKPSTDNTADTHDCDRAVDCGRGASTCTVCTYKHGNGTTVVVDLTGSKPEVWVNGIRIDSTQVADPITFAYEFDKYWGTTTSEDPVTRTLVAMTLACEAGRAGCSHAYISMLRSTLLVHIGETTKSRCDGPCQDFAGYMAAAASGIPVGAGGSGANRFGGGPTIEPLSGLPGEVAGEVASGAPRVPWIAPGSLPKEEEAALTRTLELIDKGGKPTGKLKQGWGRTWWNNKGDLPGTAGAGGYKEYRVNVPGTPGGGELRVVVRDSDDATYYSWTHYGEQGAPAFVRVR